MSASTLESTRRSGPTIHPLVPPAAIAALAFAIRFGIVLFSNGGLRGLYGYDAGVYYSAADALTFGRTPYHDFIFLHPPGLMLVLTPFAALGRVTTDYTGYIVANLFFNALAAVNAVLVWAIARRWGLSVRSALIGGLFYAVWWGAITSEVGVRLEPLGTFVFLSAILLLAGRENPSRTRAIMAGAVLGAAPCVKIWWIVPVLVVIAWYVVHRPLRRAAGYLAAGAVGGAAVITAPFLALAGREMWRRVVSDQLGRNYATQPFTRVKSVAGLTKAFPSLGSGVSVVLLVVVGAVFVLAIAVAWRRVVARMIVAVLVGQFVVLMASPSFFGFYSGYLPAALALTVAAAAEPLTVPARATGRRARAFDGRVGVTAAAVAAVLTLAALTHSRTMVDPFPGARFQKATVGLRCVMTDVNSALILMNRLSSDLRNGCPNWVDVTGHTYFGAAKSADRPRVGNKPWQRMIRRYLLSGDAVVYVRAGTGLSPATKRAIRAHPVLARGGHYVLYRVRSTG